MRLLYKLLSILGDVRAARRGPGSFVKRQVRKSAHKNLARVLRKLIK